MSAAPSLPNGWESPEVYKEVCDLIASKLPASVKITPQMSSRLWDCCGSMQCVSGHSHHHGSSWFVWTNLDADAANPSVQRENGDSIRIKDKDGSDLFISWMNT